MTMDVATARPHVVRAGPLLPALLASAATTTDGCTVTWVTDLLPDEAAPGVAELMAAGAAAMTSTLER
ncbi:hypothetical protein [Iamia sp. SCSIO 61187]|uniref:hypothetical protein n=1 Tax=Iamia sp. SCSIO 61187 TaxID=2722752 RepID=UPI00351CBE54